MDNIFEFSTYRAFLDHLIGPARRSGKKTELAAAIDCQTSYVSRIMAGGADLSPDQGFKLCQYCGLNPSETDFFLNLLNRDRAGTTALRSFYEKKIKEQQRRSTKIKARLPKATASTARVSDLAIYYSHWSYATIHVLTSIPRFRSPKAIATHLQLSLVHVRAVLAFLCRIGAVVRHADSYHMGIPLMHLDSNSPFIIQHHAGWRTRALESIGTRREDDYHYSGVFSISRTDKEKLTRKLLDFLQEFGELVADSKEETVAAICIDLFDPIVNRT